MAINAIHLDRFPEFNYDKLLWGERQIRSVANMTREDARDFLKIAAAIHLRAQSHDFSSRSGKSGAPRGEERVRQRCGRHHSVSLADWLLSDVRFPKGIHGTPDANHPWWRVMCLTGVDYFSTLGYQPGIAFLAAGVLSPIATLVLVLVTLFAALPVYSRVAAASPNGQGSIAMLEKLFPHWKGKAFVLVLLGFATTDFIITMTLSAADAADHFTHNPFTPDWMKSQMGVTLVLLAILGAVFLKGFKEAIDIAVVLVAIYLVLNGIVTGAALMELGRDPGTFHHWRQALFAQHANPLAMLGLSLILFPKLALGLSGFETGVAVMPLIKGEDLADAHTQYPQAPGHRFAHHERFSDCHELRYHASYSRE